MGSCLIRFNWAASSLFWTEKMKYIKYLTLIALLAFAASCSKDGDEDLLPDPVPPVEEPEQAVILPQKELRGAWITTVWGIDWPMGDYDAAAQQKRYTDYLDLLVANNMNAVFFQIRGMADAFYESKYESWSKNITGTAGRNPGYDVLGFLVEEAHKRGLQFHAWMNPYRISTRGSQNSSFATLDSKIPAEWTKDYNRIRIYNPALPEVQTRITDIVKEIITGYEVDGIHMDDYFYPSLEAGESMNDDAEYEKYGKGKFKNVEEFRRNNVNVVIQNIQKTIIETKPSVIFSVSPAANMDNNYKELFADVRRWLKEGWVDVIIPQIYFATGTGKNSFNTFLDQWMQYVNKTHCLIGYGIYKFGSTDPDYGSVFHTSADLKNQFEYASKKSKVNGSVLYSIKNIVANKVGIGTAIKEIYKKKTVIPYLGRTEAELPSAPANVKANGATLSWSAVPGAYYAVYKSNGDGKLATFVGTTRETSFKLPGKGTYCVTALDKVNAESVISELVVY